MKKGFALLFFIGWMMSTTYSFCYATEWSIYDKTSAMLELSKPKLVQKMGTKTYATTKTLYFQRLGHMKTTYHPPKGIQPSPKKTRLALQHKQITSIQIYQKQQQVLQTKYENARSKMEQQGFSKIWTKLGN